MSKNGWKDGKISVKKLTVSDKMPVQYYIPESALYNTGALLAGKDFNASSTAIGNVQLLKQPPYPAALIICPGAAGTAGHNDYLKIGGYDAMGKYVYETLFIKGTAGATTCSQNAFAAINYIKPLGQTSANTTIKSNKVGIGFQPIKIGLPYPISSNDDIITYAYSSAYATTSFQKLNISSTYNTVTLPATALGKSHSFIYKSKVQK